jgi:hypothetical protein
MTIEIEEEDRQTILLALAEVALSRPGWNDVLGEIAAKFGGLDMFAEFKRLKADLWGKPLG